MGNVFSVDVIDYKDPRWMKLRKMTSGEDAKGVGYQTDRAARCRRTRRTNWMGGRWWRRRGVVVLVGGLRRGVWLRHREACWRKPRLRCGDSSNVPITPDTFTRSRQIKGIYSAPAWRHSEGFIHSFCKILLLLETNWWVQRSSTARSLQFSAGEKVRRLASRLAILRLETRVARC